MKKLDQKSFIDDNLHSKQNLVLNKTSWILVGHKCEFNKVRDYKTIFAFDKPIVIYNFKDFRSFLLNLKHLSCRGIDFGIPSLS